MTVFKTIGWTVLACSLLQAQVPEDPVVKVRAQRAISQGSGGGDLPPVPKGIIEPPPLPPPEVHVRDMVRSSRSSTATTARVARKKALRKGRAAQTVKTAKAPKATKAPKAKVTRKATRSGKKRARK